MRTKARTPAQVGSNEGLGHAARTPRAWVGHYATTGKEFAAMCDEPRSDLCKPWIPLYEAPRWVPVSEGMPESGRTVLACYRNALGNWRRIRASWVAAKSREAGAESDFGEYDEATDCYYDPEGWYEQIDNWPEYTACMVNEGRVTHWMPRPEPPPPPLPVAGPNVRINLTA